MINPQENPHLLTQDYFQELLEKNYPGAKVNDIIPFFHQGVSGAMRNNRSLYYGYWYYPTAATTGTTARLRTVGYADLSLPGGEYNGSVVGSAMACYFGMGSWISGNGDTNINLVFNGFRATFDNTPSPAPTPVPQPPIGQYQIASANSFFIGTTKRYQFNIQGVPNSTVHFRMNGLTGVVTGDPAYTVRNSDFDPQFFGFFLSLIGIAPPFPVDFVTMDAFGNALFYLDISDVLTDDLDLFSIDITGATSGTPTGSQSQGLILP